MFEVLGVVVDKKFFSDIRRWIARKRWRILRDGKVATGRLGQPLDGGGHLSETEAYMHRYALNGMDERRQLLVLGAARVCVEVK